jgi:hypothetical protein
MFLLFLLFAGIANAMDFYYNTCDNNTNINNFTITVPEHPKQPGDDFQIYFKYTLNQEIPNNSSWNSTLFFDDFPFAFTHMWLCDFISCPVKPGLHINNMTFRVPSGYHNGTVYYHDFWYYGQERFLCFDMHYIFD